MKILSLSLLLLIPNFLLAAEDSVENAMIRCQGATQSISTQELVVSNLEKALADHEKSPASERLDILTQLNKEKLNLYILITENSDACKE